MKTLLYGWGFLYERKKEGEKTKFTANTSLTRIQQVLLNMSS